MITREITYQQLEPIVSLSFNGDKDIFKYYDKNVIVNDMGELVQDVLKKIKEYPIQYPDTKFLGVYEKGSPIGYFVIKDETLISFALKMEFRQRLYLKKFFSLIKEELKGRFYCSLWSRNIRAVKYLMKQGMKIMDTNPHITKLIKP